jgi:hypothetical protein
MVSNGAAPSFLGSFDLDVVMCLRLLRREVPAPSTSGGACAFHVARFLGLLRREDLASSPHIQMNILHRGVSSNAYIYFVTVDEGEDCA